MGTNVGTAGGFLVFGGASLPSAQTTFTPPWTGGVTLTQQANDSLTASVQHFGAAGSTQTTTGSLTASTTGPLTLAAAKDFANGGGVRLVGAGAAFAGANSSCTAAVVGTTGSTTISYKLVTLDSWFGYGAYYNPGSVGYTCQVTNAPSTLNGQGYVNLTVSPGYAAQFSGIIVGNILTVASVTSGSLAPGQSLPAYGNTRILTQTSGTQGGAGTYLVNSEQAITATQSGTTITVTWIGQRTVICPNDTIVGGQATGWATETITATPAGSSCSSASGTYTGSVSQTPARP